MKISGLKKCSMVDYPGKMAAVVFVPTCNMDCYYCHNRWLLSDETTEAGRHTEDEVFALLEQRRGLLDGVVVTGGEPTLQPGLERFIVEVREMGYPVKLDTNGTRPDIVSDLVRNQIVDYVAMDIKAPPARYEAICGRQMRGFCGSSIDLDAIEASIQVLLRGTVDYEFRTTVAPELTRDDFVSMANWIRGAKRYVLQQYRPLSAEWFGSIQCLSPPPLPPERIAEWARDIQHLVGDIRLRGMGIETLEPARNNPMTLPGQSAVSA